ncbi:hypothetical protein ACFXGA_18565 [Actinosynnema sp. NPDC059335]|uniref:hypothetical protein n=1 Tax=Actinosynnema sp. NPDC059335 TaxID=3346804 RepID=UPI00366CD9E1
MSRSQAGNRGRVDLHGAEKVLDDTKLRWQGDHVVAAAERRLAEQGEQAARELQPRLAEFAAELAVIEGFAAGRTAEVRQRVAADWITGHTDGLRMPRWWVKELEATAPAAPFPARTVIRPDDPATPSTRQPAPHSTRKQSVYGSVYVLFT